MKRCFVVVIASLLLSIPALAQKERPPSTTKEPTTTSSPRKSAAIRGQIAVGETAPGFELDDPSGRSVSLSSLRGRWIVLAFGDRWQELYRLQEMVQELDSISASVVGVCHEKAHTLAGVSRREKLEMRMLADVTGEVSAMYGLFDYVSSETRPGFLVLDPNGVIQLTVLGQLPPTEVIAQLAHYAIRGV